MSSIHWHKLYPMLAVVGCGSSTVNVPVTLPNGEQGSSVQCTDMTACYEAAGKACPGGYETIDKSSKTSMEVPQVAQFAYNFCVGQKSQNKNANCDDTPPTPVPVERTTMLIQCKTRGNHTEVASTSTTTSPQTATPTSAAGCTLGNRAVAHDYVARATKNDCGLPNQDNSLTSRMGFPPSAGQTQVGGLNGCTVGLDQLREGGCVRKTVWACNDERGATWAFGSTLRQTPTGITGTLKIMGTSGLGDRAGAACETEYEIESGAVQAQPAAAASLDVTGTEWSGTDSDGDQYTARFMPNGNFGFTSPSGTYTDDTWQQNGNHVSWQLTGGYARYEATVEGDHLRGSAVNQVGHSWTFDFVRSK